MATMRELKGRIESVHSSQKITGAMKMISSARLRKAENKLLQAGPYRQKLWDIYAHTERSGCEYQSPLTVKRPVHRLALIIFASDDGLCGAFNDNLLKKFHEVLQVHLEADIQKITVIPVGKRIESELKKVPRIQLASRSEGFEGKDLMQATRLLADQMMNLFLQGDYDCVEVIYAHYKSIGVQVDRSRQFLPVVSDDGPEVGVPENEPWYIYEPDCRTVLDTLFPLMLHALMYEMFMQNRTSEQAARILAMQMANDNAVKLLGKLQLEFNKLRQQGITSELMDISGGNVKE